jgi:hypothetical protein
MTSFKDGLRRFMRDRQLRDANIALDANVAVDTVRKWMSGDSNPQFTAYQRLCLRYPADGDLPAFEDYFTP